MPISVSLEKAVEALRAHWGYADFLPNQKPIVESILQGKDTIGLLPTGGGKSICFQAPAMLMDGICLVVTPIISLMNDQAFNLRKRGIHAQAIHSGLSLSEVKSVINQCEAGWVKFLYLSPERLHSAIFQEEIKYFPISLIVVDEAHCVSQWGFDFRPSYLKIGEIRAHFPRAAMAALSATATGETLKDMIRYLHLNDPTLIRSSVVRSNLRYEARKSDYLRWDIWKYLQSASQSEGRHIVYAQSRKETEKLHSFLHEKGIACAFYHAGLSAAERAKREKDFHKGRFSTMIATSAFGMGIDLPNVRSVLHAGMPESIESYYQQAGRAGRDGQAAQCILFLHDNGIEDFRKRSEYKIPSFDYITDIYKKLSAYARALRSEGEKYPLNKMSFARFVEAYTLHPADCFAAIQYLKNQSLLDVEEHNRNRHPAFRFVVGRDIIAQFAELYPSMEKIANHLLRSYPNVLSKDVSIDIEKSALELQTTSDELKQNLRFLYQQKIADYKQEDDPISIIFLEKENASVDKETYSRLKKNHIKRSDEMIAYVESDRTCRQLFFAAYFDAEDKSDCGTCDICLAKNAPKEKSAKEQIKKRIKEYLQEKEARHMQEVKDFFSSSHERERYLRCLQELEDENMIRIDKVSMLVSWAGRKD